MPPREYRELRPAGPPPDVPSAGSTPSASTERSTKRQIVVVACENCRRRKGRCDGQRPVCGPCQKRNLQCAYDAGPDATRQSALKQKYDLASQKLREMEALYHMIHSSPEPDAQKIFQLIRANSDASAVLKIIRDSNPLLQQPLSTPSPASASEPQGLPIDPQLFSGQSNSRGEGYSSLGKQVAGSGESQMQFPAEDTESDAYGEDDDETMWDLR